MEGPFKESVERCADLPEVEPETFAHFLAYAYFKSSTTTVNETAHQTSSIKRTSTSRLIELLILKGHKDFVCKTCLARSMLRFSLSFPQCGNCYEEEMSKTTWYSRCIIPSCFPSEPRKPVRYLLQGLICTQCSKELGLRHRDSREISVEGLARIQLQPVQSLKDLQSFDFDIPLRVQEILESTKDFIIPYPPFASLFDITRLAIFADLYEIESLAQAALLGLYSRLTQESLDKETIATVEVLVEVVYNTIPNSYADTSSTGTHVLRRMLSEFIAVHRDKFIESPNFMRLLHQQDGLAGDVSKATVE